jgi:ferritin-like metal-binding protein YciE
LEICVLTVGHDFYLLELKRNKKMATTKKAPAPKKATASAASKKAPTKQASAKQLPAKQAPKQQNAAKTKDSMLDKFFQDELKDIYWAEKHLVKALPKMRKAATSPELQAAFEDHLNVTKEQVGRLEEIFGLLGKKPQAKKCEAMAGLVEEGEGIIEDTEKGTATRDVGLILAAQKVEHYEIATYGGLAQLAATLGYSEIAEILQTTLAEEKETDELLTGIAENNVNYEASEEEEEEEEGEDD